ncbi:MAG: DUF2155 domain-containing protein [Qipengyuania sp.]
MRRAVALFCVILSLAACEEDPVEQPIARTEIPEELQQSAPPPANPAGTAEIGTPLEERVATLGLLNKRNNISQDIELSPGESRRVGDVIVRLQSCERTAPWELPQETGAFVQLLVAEPAGGEEFRRVFSGWLFKNSPGLNVVEHPIYDVWVKDCVMDFPGEDA